MKLQRGYSHYLFMVCAAHVFRSMCGSAKKIFRLEKTRILGTIFSQKNCVLVAEFSQKSERIELENANCFKNTSGISGLNKDLN